MYEDKTTESLLEDILDRAPEGIDTREGSIFYDAVFAMVDKMAQVYADMDIVRKLTTLLEATGESLDEKAVEHGVYRHPATPAKYSIAFAGTVPEKGERFFITDGIFFTLQQDEDGNCYLEAEELGESGNSVYAGTAAIPVESLDELESATIGELIERGVDEEDDEALRTRVFEKISGPAENGNRQHYKTWCESVDGVGRARIFPLWNGENTVKAVLVDGSGTPCSEEVVAAVQEYIDPATKGYTATVNGKTYVVGDGIGAGVANIGAHFTACAAVPLTIDISFEAELDGIISEQLAQDIREAVQSYLKDLVFGSNADAVVRVTAIGALISAQSGVLDYYRLRLNGRRENVHLDEEEVAVLGEVTVNEVL